MKHDFSTEARRAWTAAWQDQRPGRLGNLQEAATKYKNLDELHAALRQQQDIGRGI